MPIARPTKSNTADIGCSPTTSNCVIWQGPNLPCLQLCTGDTISDVVYKLATQVCDLSTTLNLSTVDLSGLKSFCTPDVPAADIITLTELLSAITKSIGCLFDSVPTASSSSAPLEGNSCLSIKTSSTYAEAINNIAGKLTFILGGKCTSTVSVIDDLYTLIGGVNSTDPNSINYKLNALATSIGANTRDIATINGQSVTVGAASSLSGPTILAAVNELEKQIAYIGSALDSATKPDIDKSSAAIVTATATGVNLATGKSLVQPNVNLINLDGWKSDESSTYKLANSINNLWVALMDVRNAVKLIQDNCCKITCDSVIVDFIPKFDSVAKTLTLDFSVSDIPYGFVDNGTDISVTDVNGTSVHVKTNSETVPYQYIVYYTGTSEPKTQHKGTTTIPIDGLATGKLLVSFKNNFQLGTDSSATVCNNCFSKEVMYVNDSCCAITNTGSAAVTLTIKTC